MDAREPAVTKLLEKLGFTPDDIKKVQAEQAKAVKAAQKQAKAEADAADKAARRGNDRRGNKEVTIRNTNSAMGQLLMKAYAQSGMKVEAEAPAAKSGAKGKTDNSFTDVSAAGSGLSHLGSLVKDKKKLAEELGIGEITLTDIIKELEKPGRDPREDMPKPILRTDVMEMKDLKEGMILKGTVRNVIDFGVFVDIGVHQDGLVHVSQITNKKFIKHPLDAVSVGDIVEVKVMSVDLKKQRIQLTMII